MTMDKGKGRGDFATAYKLSRTGDDSSKRVHRRSLEWKETRRDLANKRRNIAPNDLSPVLEGDMSQQPQDKSYKGQTPKKAPTTDTSSKVNNRLEMLKKWKAEKAEKKKEEERNRKAPMFKVSGKIEHKDASLLYKAQSVKGTNKPTAPASKPHTAAAPMTKTAGVKPSTSGVKPSTRAHAATAKSPLHHGSLRGTQKSTMLKKAHSPKAATLKKSRSPKMLKRPHSPKASAAAAGGVGTRTRQTRSTSQQVPTKAQPATTTRQLRGQAQPKQATVAKQAPGKQKAEVVKQSEMETEMETETSVVKTPPPRVSMSKVTRRGDTNDTLASFAPDDTTFSAPASVTSFDFKPLSPASAAVFLFPNQDPNACASFFETKPSRASTPKSADKEKAQKADETVVPNTAESTKIEANTEAEKENEEPEMVLEAKSSPPKRRSSRRSVSHVEDNSDNDTSSKDIPSANTASATPRRSTRRSVGQAADVSSDNETVPKPQAVTPARSARKSRRSVLPTVSETDTTSSETEVAVSEKNVIGTPSQSSKRSRRSLRRSVISSSLTEQTEEEESCSPAKRSRSSRRSVLSAENMDMDDNEQSSDSGVETSSTRKSSQKSNVNQDTDEADVTKENADTKDQNKEETPRRSRRSTRRSNVSQMKVDSVSSEANKVVNSENQNRENIDSNPDSNDMNVAEDVKSEKRVTRARFRDTVSDSITPARQKGKAGRKSFGGFAMPNSNSCVLSAKRRGRKSMMPRSPEEWVKLLNNSPMVEMSRRTPKAANKSASMIVPPLNFDDIDLENIPPADGAGLSAMSPAPREDTGTQTSNLTQPMATLNLGLGDATLMASPLATSSASPAPGPIPMAASPTQATPVTSHDQSVRQAPASPEQAPEPMVSTPGTSQTDAAVVGPQSPRPGTSSATAENLQVEEVTSTCNEDYLSDEQLGIKHFRDLLESERTRLRGLCNLWDEYNDSASDLSDDIRGQIRTVIGQAVLLMNERFHQFNGLVDNCEFKRGEKETTVTDLQGFWDMIYFQVEDVINKFEQLEKLKNNNWVEDKPKPVAKKVVKKKVTKPVAPKPAGKSKFAAFRAQMKKQKQTESSGSPMKEEEKVFEVPGFFQVASPVRSPRPHCEGGTPKKSSSRQATPVLADSAKDSLAVPSAEQPGSQELLNRTPARKSYAPVIPSPLLKDTTPLPRPVRSCTKKTPVPKRLLDQTEPMAIDESHPAMQNVAELDTEKKTPKRRSMRPRKSVTFDQHVQSADSPAAMTVNSPETVECSDSEFARLLQPMSVLQANESAHEANDSFSKYLKPRRSLNTSVEKENTPKQSGRRRRSSLKTTKSAEKRRSNGHVHFVSPVNEHEQSLTMPHTPYNRDSLVKQKRVTRHSDLSSTEKPLDVFDIENIDDEDTLGSLPSPFSRTGKQTKAPKQTGRPSLLYTPPKTKTRTPTNKNVPTATLISFSP